MGMIHGATRMKVTILYGGLMKPQASRTFITTWARVLGHVLDKAHRSYYERRLLREGWVADTIGANKVARVTFALHKGYVPLELFKSKADAMDAKRVLMEEYGIKGRVFGVGGGRIWILGVTRKEYRRIKAPWSARA